MITGDNGITASSIARQVGMPNYEKIITGKEINEMSDEILRERVKDVSVFFKGSTGTQNAYCQSF